MNEIEMKCKSEKNEKWGFVRSQTRPYETWGFKTTFLSLRDKTLIWEFCVGDLGHHPVEC